MSQVTVIAGVKELKAPSVQGIDAMAQRQRRHGGGRKAITSKYPRIIRAVEEIVDPSTRADPMAPLKWTCESLENIKEELSKSGYEVSCPTIGTILREQLEYSL
jgi:hypothetical protein